MNTLLTVAEEAGVAVVWRDLGRRRGEYRHAPAIITLNPRMSIALQRSTLAHELGHHHHGDTWTDDPRLTAIREHRADTYAAALLIRPDAYAAAEALVGPHPGAIARELDIAVYVVQAWQERRLTFVPTPRRSA
jgi:Zn-dependent peptidase ImmA (M78 family)